MLLIVSVAGKLEEARLEVAMVEQVDIIESGDQRKDGEQDRRREREKQS